MTDPKLEFAREYQRKIPFLQHLGIVTEELGEGSARLSMPVAPQLTNSFGAVHGGVIMSLLDVALCTAARTLYANSIGVITIDMHTSFLDTGRGERLLAEAKVLKDGRTLTFVEGQAMNPDGTLVAKAAATVRVRVREK